MAVPIAVIIRFEGKPDDLLERFERARARWIEAQGDDYEQPILYATAMARGELVIVTAWSSAIAHRSFGEGIGGFVAAEGMARPETEHLRVARLGWD